MAIGGVVINFAARTADAVRDVGKLTKELGKTDDKAGGLGSTLKKGLAGAAGLVGGAMLTAGAAMIDFAKAASEDAAEAEVLAKTLRKLPGVTQAMVDANADWIDSMEIATGVADSDLRRAVSKLALATGDLTRAQQLTALAADAAAGSGKNLDSITQALAKAVQGNTSALQRQFPWLDKNKDGTVSLDEALDGLKGAYTGAAEVAADRKPFERLNIVFQQIKEKLGDQLLPYLEDLSKWLKNEDNRKQIDKWAASFGSLARAIFTVGAAIANFIGWYNRLPSWLKNPFVWGAEIWEDRPWNRKHIPITSPSSPVQRGGMLRNGYANSPAATSSTTIIVQGSLNPQRTAQDLAGMLAGARVRTGYAGIRA